MKHKIDLARYGGADGIFMNPFFLRVHFEPVTTSGLGFYAPQAGILDQARRLPHFRIDNLHNNFT